MGPNNISSKNVFMPAADLPASEQIQTVSTAIIGELKINYGDEAKVNRLSTALENVKSSQNLALKHVEDTKSKIAM